MTIYIVLFLYIIILNFIFDFSKISFHQNKNAKLNYYFFCGILFLVVILSYRVGTDTVSFADTFPNFPTLNKFKISKIDEFRHEPGWVLINVVNRSTFNDFFFIRLVSAGVINLFIFYLFFKYCKKPYAALFLYYTLLWTSNSFETLRQDMSMIFYFWGVISFIKNDKKGYLLKALPCVIFHKTGIIIYLLTYLLFFIKIKNIYVYICWLLVFCTSYLFSLVPDLVTIINIYSEDTSNVLINYSESEAYGNDAFNLKGIIGYFIWGPLLYGLIIFFDKKSMIFRKLIFLLLLFSTLQFTIAIFYRFTFYLLPFFYITISNFIFEYFKKKTIICIILFLGLSLNIFITIRNFYLPKDLSYISKLGYGDFRYVPYSSIFDPIKYKRRILDYDTSPFK